MVWPCLLWQPIATTMALTAAARHLRPQLSPLISRTLPSVAPPTTWVARMSFYPPKQRMRCVSGFAKRPSQLAATPCRIEFALLRTASSPPVALHPASQRRSYLRLRGLGLPRHGLSPCCVRAFTGALGWHSQSPTMACSSVVVGNKHQQWFNKCRSLRPPTCEDVSENPVGVFDR